jgi:poly-gamma-glutamate capsule biosynthesis protein CapA/YwtB (metallophosphatase superfamily)
MRRLTQGSPTGKKPFHFRAHPRTLDLLTAAGIDAVSLANNHSRDFGPAAFDDAVSRLHAANIRTLDGTPSPHTFTIRNHPFAAFACEDSVTDKFLHSIKTAADSATVIVFPHWGTEHATQVDQTQLNLADRLIAAGAKLVIGSGPHTRQPLEFRNGALIAWSLGNLIFDGPGPDLHWSRGTLLEIELRPDGNISRALPHPIRIENTGTAAFRK